ncbi:MAG: efflux RND transporter periplasmic adaptor subunit [Acidobacteria bacterium]|nr:efflux RND transporter periplasmic adaptor subunit [Acidobacteriota bacterium]
METHPMKPLLLVLGLPFLALAACGGGEKAHEATPPPEPVAVRVATAQPRAVARTVEAPGSIQAVTRVSPGTKILGRIEKVEVTEGQRVRRGQILASLESRDLRAAVQQAQSGLEVAEAQLDNARAQRDRMQELHSRGSATEKGLEDAVAAFRIAEAMVTKSQADISAAKVQLDYASIRSPVDGWVVVKSVEPGDMAAPGAPLFTIEDLSKVEVVVQVPEADVVGLAEGAPAQVEVLGTSREARIDRVVPGGDPASRTFEVRLLLDNPQGELKSGMFARASFSEGEEEILALPAASLVNRGQLTGAYVVGEDGRARLRWLKTGRQLSGDGEAVVEILSGLREGERYVVSPPPALQDGAPVTASQGAAS